jgi:hypothetical protein
MITNDLEMELHLLLKAPSHFLPTFSLGSVLPLFALLVYTVWEALVQE